MRKLLAIAALALAACGSSSTSTVETPTVATPTFSPAAGTYHAVQSVSVACATAGAAIHFTVDGSTPTASSPTYAGPIAVTTTTTIKAMATLTGQNPSAVASATYTLQAATPVISPAAGTYPTAQSVTITSATPGAAIHYTTDGSTPTAASPTYAAAIPLPLGGAAATTTVKAIALATGFADSAVASSTFVIDPAATPAATPTFSPPAGTYAAAQSVTIATTTAGATIHYTTDGSTPTTTSAAYSTPVAVAASLTLKAIAAGGGHTASPVATAAYVITLPAAATPTFTPGAGTYPSAQSVTIASTTVGAVLHYTTDGSTPTASSTTYVGPVPVAGSMTIKAIATAAGYATSAVGSATYVIGGGGSGDFLTVCNALFDKMGSLMTTCLHANPGFMGFIETIVAPMRASCPDLQKEIDAGLIAFTPAQAAACASAIEALTCDSLSGTGGVSIPAACESAMVGTVATGGTCYSSNDCAAGYCTWDLLTGTCPGTCQPFAALGQPCSVPEMCASGQVCDAGTCKAPSAVGGDCPCLGNLWCDGSNVCRAYATAGSSCVASNVECNIFTICAGSPATCQSYVGLGATCDPADSVCGFGYDCDAGTSKCVSWPVVGQACPDGICLTGYCDVLGGLVCADKKADGATCTRVRDGVPLGHLHRREVRRRAPASSVRDALTRLARGRPAGTPEPLGPPPPHPGARVRRRGRGGHGTLLLLDLPRPAV